MAVITNYTTLQTAVGDYLARSDLTTFIPNFIQNWEEGFFADPDNYGPWMESALSVAIASDVAAVPSDFLALKVAYISGSPGVPLIPLPLSQLYDKYPRGGGSAKPRYIARDRTNFVFGPVPDSTYTVAGTYYAKPTLIRNDGDGVNDLVTNHPQLMLYGALLDAEPFLKNDPRVQLWELMYSKALTAYRRLQRAGDYSGQPPVMVTG